MSKTRLKNKEFIKRNYTSRDERNEFMVDYLKKYFESSVLNVGGGGEKYLEKYLPKETRHVEIDIAGNPHYIVNLEKDLPLQFSDSSFETVCCNDVLEHVDNFHAVLDELIRVTSKYVIISLPNCTNGIFNYILDKPYKSNTDISYRKKHGHYYKFYGLPYEKPNDRHKHFFSYTEAESFFDYYAKERKLNILEMFGLNYFGRSLKGKILRFITSSCLGNNVRKNLFCSSIWIVLEKSYDNE